MLIDVLLATELGLALERDRLVWVAEGEKSKGAPPGDIVAPELELKLRKEDKTLPLKALAVELAVTFVLNWI